MRILCNNCILKGVLMDLFTIYFLCSYGVVMAGVCIAIGTAIESKLVSGIGMAALLAIVIYRIWRTKCPCCKRHLIFIPRRWDGRCTHCGTKIP